jgi:hypothetical protein
MEDFATNLEEVKDAIVDEEKSKDPSFLKRAFMKVSKALGLKVQEISHDELRSKLQAKVDELDRPTEPTLALYHYVLDVYDDYLVFEARKEGEDPVLYKQSFTVDEQNNVALVGRPEEVIQETEYVAASASPVVNAEAEESTTGTLNIETETKGKEEQAMDRTEKVNALITCEQNQWCEDDREFLVGLNDDQFTKIEALTATKEEPSTTEDPEAVAAAEAAAEAKAQADAEAEAAAAEATATATADEEPVKVQKLEDLVANADPELRESIEAGQKMLREQKDALVKGIMEIKTNKFTEDQLRSKSMDELTALAELGRVEVDFSGKGGGEITEEKTVPDAPKMRWNKSDGSPDYSHLDE